MNALHLWTALLKFRLGFLQRAGHALIGRRAGTICRDHSHRHSPCMTEGAGHSGELRVDAAHRDGGVGAPEWVATA